MFILLQLTQVNKRWHKYNSDMQIFIDKLQSTIRDQQEQINNIGEEQSYLHKRVSHTEIIRQKTKKNLYLQINKLDFAFFFLLFLIVILFTTL